MDMIISGFCCGFAVLQSVEHYTLNLRVLHYDAPQVEGDTIQADHAHGVEEKEPM